jgi:hypothetical protein
MLSIALAGEALADEPTIGTEVIYVEGTALPKVFPRPKKAYGAIAPPYSDYAIEHDTWTRAWVLLDIDARGVVKRVKLLKKPGADLDKIAVDRAFSMRFDPARDGAGNAVPMQLVTNIDWVSWGWMIMHEGVGTRIPAQQHIERVPCAGSGRPLQMDSKHPTYRDCSQPDLSKIATERWITR